MSHKVLKCVNKVETGEFKQGGTGGFSLGSSAHIWGQETHNILAFLLLLGWHWLEFTMYREFEYQSVSVQRYNTLGCCILSSIMLALLSSHSPWQCPQEIKRHQCPFRTSTPSCLPNSQSPLAKAKNGNINKFNHKSIHSGGVKLLMQSNDV